MSRITEKPDFDGPRFFELRCSCDGGRISRRGWFAWQRRKLFGPLKKKCPLCHGRGMRGVVYDRDNTLVWADLWQWTQDGDFWVATYNFLGRRMSWVELDEAMCPRDFDFDYDEGESVLSDDPSAFSNVIPLRPPD